MAKRQTKSGTRTRRASTPKVVLLGGGGHAIVVAEAATLKGWKIVGFFDDRPDAPAAEVAKFLGHLNPISPPLPKGAGCIVCIGDVGVRRRVLDGLIGVGLERFATVVHPTAFVSPSAKLGRGVFVGPGAVVHSRAAIGDHAIINSGAIIEHDCVIGENTHVAPGSVVAGAARVGRDSLIGVGARVIPKVVIGERVTVGAGGVVVADVAPGRTVKGVPAK